MRPLPATLAILLTLVLAAARAQEPAAPPSRGALLYDNHCSACHSQQMHWRARRRAVDWSSLREQVRQWQGQARLGWSEEDIEAVTRHLNDTIYRYPEPEGRAHRGLEAVKASPPHARAVPLMTPVGSPGPCRPLSAPHCTPMVTVILWALFLLLALLVLLVAVLWSIRRQRDVSLRLASSAGIDQLLPTLAGLSLGPVIPGNSVELLENGRYFDVLLERIRAARCSLHLETFLWKDGEIGRRLGAALAERAKAGCGVRLLLDANGCRRMGRDTLRGMRQAGCKVVFFHDNGWRNIGWLNNRDHRKLVVIDGREALVGGHCIVDAWLGDAEDHEHNADLSVLVRGPVVNTLQGVFSENWVSESSELFGGEDHFPHLDCAGHAVVHPAWLKPEGSAPSVKILHHAAICLARERIWIQNPYFIPQPAAIDALGEAVARGVDVRVLMPATSGSDNPMVQHAGHRNFEKLLRCGVRLFEYPHTLLHQKVMTIDRVWSAIGSSNFDDRSFETNDELTLGVLDVALAARLDAVFEKYVARAEELELEAWRLRGAWHKLEDNAAYMFHLLL